MKIQTKITLLFVLLCTSIIVAFSFAVYYFTYTNASQDFYTRLELRANIAARVTLEKDEGSAAFAQLRKEHVQRLPNEREYIINTDTLTRLQNSDFYNEVPASFLQAIMISNKAGYRKDFDFFTGIHYENEGSKYIVIVSAENTFLKEFLRNLSRRMVTGSVLSVIIVLSAGFFFSKQILAPVRNITRQVQRITATSLHLRLNARDGTDEISALNNTFNDMLSRLETAFDSQNNFVSNASHELNTPLTSIIGEADYALAKPRTEEQYKQSFTIIMQQGEKLKEITESLVQLARAGFTDNLTMTSVNIRELLHNSKLNMHHVYNTCSIQNLSIVPEELNVMGNPQLLELAISNVLLNACKYSSSKPVTVEVNSYGKEVKIIVRDQGIGIPKNELKNIFDPFFRASNVKNVDGYGIGLPLTQNILRLHKGTIVINSSEQNGTEVVVTLKAE